MIVAVLGTNVIVSGTLVWAGIPSRILDAIRARRFTLVTSGVIVDEVLRTLQSPRFSGSTVSDPMTLNP